VQKYSIFVLQMGFLVILYPLGANFFVKSLLAASPVDFILIAFFSCFYFILIFISCSAVLTTILYYLPIIDFLLVLTLKLFIVVKSKFRDVYLAVQMRVNIIINNSSMIWKIKVLDDVEMSRNPP